MFGDFWWYPAAKEFMKGEIHFFVGGVPSYDLL